MPLLGEPQRQPGFGFVLDATLARVQRAITACRRDGAQQGK